MCEPEWIPTWEISVWNSEAQSNLLLRLGMKLSAVQGKQVNVELSEKPRLVFVNFLWHRNIRLESTLFYYSLGSNLFHCFAWSMQHCSQRFLHICTKNWSVSKGSCPACDVHWPSFKVGFCRAEWLGGVTEVKPFSLETEHRRYAIYLTHAHQILITSSILSVISETGRYSEDLISRKV